jgi:hypothetical protein
MAGTIGLRVKVIESFFDKQKIVKAADRATFKGLSKAGAFVMRAARKRIKKGGKKREVSRPGQSPRGHTGALQRNIFFAYDKKRKSVVIGPVKLNGKIGNAPQALERGGRSQRRHTRLNGAKSIVTITVQKRPYMGPALVGEAPKFPHFYEVK